MTESMLCFFLHEHSTYIKNSTFLCNLCILMQFISKIFVHYQTIKLFKAFHNSGCFSHLVSCHSALHTNTLFALCTPGFSPLLLMIPSSVKYSSLLPVFPEIREIWYLLLFRRRCLHEASIKLCCPQHFISSL